MNTTEETTSVDSITNTLNLFALELPDADEELSVQPHPLESFTLFLKLPLELRRMIWRSTFPSRLIEICTAWMYVAHWQPGNTSLNEVLPITSQINQESRVETLMAYKRFEPPTIAPPRSLVGHVFPSWVDPSTIPSFINMANDSIAIDVGIPTGLPDPYNDFEREAFVLFFDTHSFDSVRTLILTDFEWDILEFWEVQKRRTDEVGNKLTLLPYFRTLDFLIVMNQNGHAGRQWWTDIKGPRGRNALKKRVEDYVAWLKAREPSRSLPKVVLVPHQPITRALHENS